MRLVKLFLPCAILLLAGSVLAGELSPKLELMLAEKQNDDPITVLVVMHERVDILALDQSLHDQRVDLADRHVTVIETLKAAARSAQADLTTSLEARRGTDVVSFTPHWLVNGVIVTGSEAAIREIAAREDVEIVEPNLVPEVIEPARRYEADSADRGIGITPGVVSIGARRVWDELGIRGEGALIGGLDTGVDGDHPAFADRWRGNHAPWQECWLDVVGSVSTFPNEKLHIFVVDTGGMGDGYVCPTSMGWCEYYCLHIDGVQMYPIDGDYALSVTAHETFHMIHHFLDGNEHPWVDESLAEAAMTANGFYTDDAWVSSFLHNTDVNWGPGDPDHGAANYGAFLLWGTYLWEHGGADLMGAITAESSDGWVGLDAALAATGDDEASWDLFLDMIVAIYLDEPDLGYGCESFDFDPVSTLTELGPGEDRDGHLNPYGIDYYDLDPAGSMGFEITSDVAAPVTALAVSVGAQVTIEDVSEGGQITVESGEIGFLAVTAELEADYSIVVN